MFHCEIKQKLHGISKSGIINIIGFLQAYGFSITFFILPLYLFSVFNSAFIIGKIESSAAIFGIFLTGILSFFLLKIKKHTLLKLGFIIGIFGIISFIFINTFFDAFLSRILMKISTLFVLSLLTLYLKNLTEPREYIKKEGIYHAIMNISWLVGPIMSGFLLNFISKNKEDILNIFPFLQSYSEGLEYNILLFIGSFFLLLSIIVFIFGKFVIKHPHLQKIKISKKNKEVHKVSNFYFFFDFFKNKYRTIAFISLLFKGTWIIFLYSFFGILLLENNISQYTIGIIIGLLCLPNILVEGFVGNIYKKFGGEIPTLLFGYLIFGFFFLIAMIVGIKNIYFFTFLLILSQIGYGLIESLNDILYFKGTNTKNENKFFSIYKLSEAFAKLIVPLLVGFFASIYSIKSVFFTLPIIILIIFGIIFFIWKKAKEPSIILG